MKKLALWLLFLLAAPSFAQIAGGPSRALQVQNNGTTVGSSQRINFLSGCSAALVAGSFNVTCTPGTTLPAAPTTAGINYALTSAAGTLGWSYPGIQGRTITSATTDSLVYTDAAAFVIYNDGVNNLALTVPPAGSTNFANNFFTALANTGTGNIFLTTSTSTFNGSGQTASLYPSSSCTLHSLDNANWLYRCVPLLNSSGILAVAAIPSVFVNFQNATSYPPGAIQTFGVDGSTSSIVIGSVTTPPCCSLQTGSLYLLTLGLNNSPHLGFFDGQSYPSLLTNADTPSNFANGTTGSGPTVEQTGATMITPNLGDATVSSLTVKSQTGDFLDLQSGLGFKVAGAVTSGTSVSNETVIQQTTLATSTLVGTVTGSGPMIIKAVTGVPDASHIWVGSSSGMQFTPTAVPAIPYCTAVAATGHIRLCYGSDNKLQLSNGDALADVLRTSDAVSATQLPNPTVTTLGGIKALVATSHLFVNAISALGAAQAAQPSFADLSGNALAAQMPWTLSGTTTVVGTVFGTLTAGDSVVSDSSGNLIDGGAATGTGGAIAACTVTSPVQVNAASTITAQNLMACTIPSGALNSLNRHLTLRASGVATIPAGGTAAQVTVAFTLGGTTLCTRNETSNMSVGLSSAPWIATCDVIVTTAGASGAFEASEIANLPSTSATQSIAYVSANGAVVSPFNLTGSLALQVTIAVNANSAATNQFVATERMLSAHVED